VFKVFDPPALRGYFLFTQVAFIILTIVFKLINKNDKFLVLYCGRKKSVFVLGDTWHKETKEKLLLKNNEFFLNTSTLSIYIYEWPKTTSMFTFADKKDTANSGRLEILT